MEHKRLVIEDVLPAPRGRPRSEAANTAILDASIALIRDIGYDAVTMEGIAARARVGKATLYRRWTAKETLVAEAVERIVNAFPVPDTGSTEADILVLLRYSLAMYGDPATGPLLSGLVAAMVRSQPIAQAVRSGFVAAWRDAMRIVLRRGIARGELRSRLDADLVIDLLAAPLLYRFLITGAPVDDALVRHVVAAVMRAFAPSPPAPRPRSR